VTARDRGAFRSGRLVNRETSKQAKDRQFGPIAPIVDKLKINIKIMTRIKGGGKLEANESIRNCS
jgi:hypothetical protein